MKKTVSKLLLLFVALFVALGLSSCTKKATTTQSITTNKVSTDGTLIYLHYYRFQADYDNWDVWAWESKPKSADGAAFAFTADTGNDSYGGKVATIAINSDYTEVGFLIRRGGNSWTEKDVATDRMIEVPEGTDKDHPLHIYVLEGTKDFGYSLNQAPHKDKTFKTAWFTKEKEIQVTATNEINVSSLKLYENDNEVTIASITPSTSKLSCVIALDKNVDYLKTYTLKGTFDSEQTIQVTFQGLFDTDGWAEAFNYSGTDLGVTISNNQTSFRLWAPIASKVMLNLYATGTTASDSSTAHPGSDTPISQIEMKKDIKGTWVYLNDSNLSGTYYTYSVTNGKDTNEVVDPYAKGCGVNGKRGLVVDFTRTNPLGWTYGKRPNDSLTYNDQIIYELQVRDYTIDTTFNGKEKKGTYSALAESGTTYETYKTGFDHLKELGITTIQIMPFYDWSAGVDETKMDDSSLSHYNWGYMPLNYNCLEGSFATDPYDGLSRITEFKKMVMAYTDAGIRINMDVVYNHTGLTADSNFSFILPGYYYRLNADGSYSNGSGCGNEVASERYMARKFILDSTQFWINEYNLSGFRFDLMGIEDIETMNEVADNLHNINPSIMIYGEPWTGGSTTLDSSKQGIKLNMNLMPNIGAFDDNFRDGVKGSVFSSANQGFVEGNNAFNDQIQVGITGKFTPTVGNVSQVINYVACHDNNTLHDKLAGAAGSSSEKERLEMAKQAYAMVLLSEGIPFISEGDEFLKAKINADGTYNSNSYNASDEVNKVRWSLIKDNAEMNEYVRELIAVRKSHSSFRLTTNSAVSSSLSFLSNLPTGVIAYKITNSISNDTYQTIIVIHANNTVELTLESGSYYVMMNETGLLSSETKVSSKISIKKNETIVLHS